MRWWLFTNTTYGTWLPGDARGSVTSVRDRRPDESPAPTRREHDRPGEPWEPARPGLERAARFQQKAPAILLQRKHAEALVRQFEETGRCRRARLLAASIMPTHFHLVVEAQGDPDPHRLLAAFKAYGTRVLSRTFGRPPSKTWWTDKGSKRKLPDERALSAAIHYVLHKQPGPLLTWSPDHPLPNPTPGEPGA